MANNVSWTGAIPLTQYSTEEKVVGTWIDGKPIYQRVVQLPNETAAKEYVSVSTSGWDIDKPLNKYGFANYVGDGITSVPLGGNRIVVWFSRTEVALQTINLTSYCTDIYIVCEYTKTTD